MKFTGANILIHAVPVILIASLSCFYLHLQKKSDNLIDKRYLIFLLHFLHQYQLSKLTVLCPVPTAAPHNPLL